MADELPDGFYLHEHDTPVTTIEIAGERHRFVSTRDFMAVQKERDDYRKVLALVNEALFNGNIDRACLLVAQAGFTVEDARAMSGVIAWALSETKT